MSDQSFKLAVIGNESSVLIFRALGTEVFSVFSDEEARNVVVDLMGRHRGDEAQTAEYAVIFVEETYYKTLPEDLLERLAKKSLPAVIPVPSPDSKGGKDSFSVKRLSKIVERAIGSDILS